LQRLEAIRKELLKSDEVSIEDMAEKFGVHAMTIRRDLQLLESRGEAVRTYGGAAFAQKLSFEFAFRDKQNEMAAEKHAIAKKAVEHVKDGHVVLLDTGTTTLQIARELAGKRKVTIITISLAIISELQFAEDIQLLLLGGFLRQGAPDIYGPLTEQCLDSLTADIAFMGADGIDYLGNIYGNEMRFLNLDRKMADVSEKAIVVADSSKMGKHAMCKVYGAKKYDSIITDSGINDMFLMRIGKKGVKVEVA